LENSANVLSAVKQKSLQLFSEHVQMSGDRSSAGKLFQTTGPCTAKLRLRLP